MGEELAITMDMIFIIVIINYSLENTNMRLLHAGEGIGFEIHCDFGDKAVLERVGAKEDFFGQAKFQKIEELETSGALVMDQYRVLLKQLFKMSIAAYYLSLAE